MSDRDALLAAILAHPDEDTPRLMYADWLDENGTLPSQRARAEFIRVQCELAKCGHLVEPRPAWCDPKYVNPSATIQITRQTAYGSWTTVSYTFESPHPVAEEVGDEVRFDCPGLGEQRLRIVHITERGPRGRRFKAVQCGGPQPEPTGVDRPREWWRAMTARERELLDGHSFSFVEHVWCGRHGGFANIVIDTLPDEFPCVLFRRGFVEDCQGDTAAWIAHGRRMMETNPISLVRLLDVEAFGNDDDGQGYFWERETPAGPFGFAPSILPAPLFDRLSRYRGVHPELARWYDDFDRVREAIEEACLAYGRSELPEPPQ